MELEKEEDELEAAANAEMEDEDSGLDDEEQDLVDRIRGRKREIIRGNIDKSTNNKPHLPRKYRVRKMGAVEKKLGNIGLDTSKLRERSVARRGRKRTRDSAMTDA